MQKSCNSIANARRCISFVLNHKNDNQMHLFCIIIHKNDNQWQCLPLSIIIVNWFIFPMGVTVFSRDQGLIQYKDAILPV